jgi:hypothetical protein
MSLYGTITIEFDGFTKYLDCEFTHIIRGLTKQLQDTHNSLQTVIRGIPAESRATYITCCLPFVGRWRRTNLVGHSSNVNLNSQTRILETRLSDIQHELEIMVSRREFIHTPEFKEKVLGQCPICFEELVNKNETTIVPLCMHPICKGCFEMIYNHPHGYKCPLCCATMQSFYEVWFCTFQSRPTSSIA